MAMVNIAELPKYDLYKESELEWLREVPAEWVITRLKFASRINPPPRVEREKVSENACFLPMESVHSSGKVEYGIQKPIKELRQGFTSFQRGDVIVAKITPCFENGKGAYLETMPTEYGFGSTEFHVLRAGTEFSPKFIYYLTKSDLFMKLGERLMTGSAGQKRVQTEFVANFNFAYPSLDSQRHIVDFLDKKTAQIDEAIAIKEKQIVLLKERKQIIIQKAVTQGLDPNVPMKDSGVDWIGKIPAHWHYEPIKYSLFGVIDCEHKTAPFVDETEYFVVRTTNVKNGKLVFEGAKYTNEKGYKEWTRRGVPRAGDVLLTREAPAGEACLVPNDLKVCLGQRMVWLKINRQRLLPEFAISLIYSSVGRTYIDFLSSGSTVLHFNMADINNIPVLLPPLEEQIELVQYIERETSQTDIAIHIQYQQIEKLKEYKTTLINSAVTGKIKVTPEMAGVNSEAQSAVEAGA